MGAWNERPQSWILRLYFYSPGNWRMEASVGDEATETHTSTLVGVGSSFMKIRCIANTGSDLPESYLDPRRGYKKEMEFPLTIGKEYIVYAFYVKQGQVWYYICEDNYMYYPMPSPAPLFEVVDNRMSAYWRFKLYPNGLLEVAFEQWFSAPDFYDKLTDQKEEEVLIFEKTKEMIDAEALSPKHQLTAIDKSLEMANLSG